MLVCGLQRVSWHEIALLLPLFCSMGQVGSTSRETLGGGSAGDVLASHLGESLGKSLDLLLVPVYLILVT
jgi:hypothetical protein